MVKLYFKQSNGQLKSQYSWEYIFELDPHSLVESLLSTFFAFIPTNKIFCITLFDLV